MDNSGGPPAAAWTPKLVADALRDAYRRAQRSGRSEDWERIRKLTQVDPQERRLLVTWASRVTGAGDGSIRELCRERGIDSKTFYRRLDAAAQLAVMRSIGWSPTSHSSIWESPSRVWAARD